MEQIEKIVNLTRHNINIAGITFPTDKNSFPPRCLERVAKVGNFAGVPLIVKTYSQTVGLPPQQPNTLYIVSNIVRQANPERNDLASPGRKVIASGGKIIGILDLVVNTGRLENIEIIDQQADNSG